MHEDDDEAGDRLSREEILAKYGWKDDAERAEAYAEVERRQRQIDAEAREAAQREAATRSAIIAAGGPAITRSVTKSYPPSTAAAPTANADGWDDWRKFILATVRKEKFVTDDMLGRVLKEVAKIERESDLEVCRVTKDAREEALDPLRKRLDKMEAQVFETYQRLVELDGRIDEIRVRQRAEAQFKELQERIRQLEEAPSGRAWKVIG